MRVSITVPLLAALQLPVAAERVFHVATYHHAESGDQKEAAVDPLAAIVVARVDEATDVPPLGYRLSAGAVSRPSSSGIPKPASRGPVAKVTSRVESLLPLD